MLRQALGLGVVLLHPGIPLLLDFRLTAGHFIGRLFTFLFKDGREVLEDVKADPELRKIPVVVFTTSNTPEDVSDVYGRYANSFVTKPVDLDRYAATVKSISDYWFGTVTLPA